MITVRFLRWDDKEVHRTGPIPWLRAADGLLQAGPDGNEIARYRGSTWTVAGHAVTKCRIQAPECIARFEGDPSQDSVTHGPFHKMEIVDGSIYAQPGRQLLARFDEQARTWYSYLDKRTWPNLVVEKSR